MDANTYANMNVYIYIYTYTRMSVCLYVCMYLDFCLLMSVQPQRGVCVLHWLVGLRFGELLRRLALQGRIRDQGVDPGGYPHC